MATQNHIRHGSWLVRSLPVRQMSQKATPTLVEETPSLMQAADSKTAGVLKGVLRTKLILYVLGAIASIPVWWKLAHVIFNETEEGVTADMVNRFYRGVDGLTQKDLVASVVRDELRVRLRKILAPDSIEQYYVILGEKGVGKSTAVRQTLAELEKPRGAIYVMTPEFGRDAFLHDVAEAVHYRPALALVARLRRWLNGVDKNEDSGRVDHNTLAENLFKKLKEVGAAYAAEYGRPPVLVVDGADILHKTDPQFLTHLQTLAKTCADNNSLLVVFVMSEKAAFNMLQSHSHASRSKVFVVGDVEDNEAVKFLVSKGIDEKNATAAVARITGGRFALLNDYISDHQDGATNDQVLANYKRATKSALKRLRVNVSDDIFRCVSGGSCFEDDDGIDVEKLAQLARENILTINPKTRLVTFNSRHVQMFFTETGLFLTMLSPYLSLLPLE